MTNTFIAYTRVSTQKQGNAGVSLTEQRRAIESYARRRHLKIAKWYEELATAAKQGRPVFQTVLSLLDRDAGKTGLVLHKIDRGARNLRDWADIGELLDQGIEVRFAHDDLDLWTRGGRLTADIQAVIAADYIRNLRDEVRKGINGRLNQGLYPFKAPRGYLDRGRGKVKQPDPAVAPLVVFAFQLYGAGQYSLNSLGAELCTRGLSTASGRALSPGTLAKILRNPFYKGDINVQGRSYKGKHQPLVTGELFDHVQEMLARRRPKRSRRHCFQFSRCLRCTGCENFLIGEKQKQFVYYRCHSCAGVCIREDRVSASDPRFHVFSEATNSEYGQLEPWEKFDSPSGIDSSCNVFGDQRLS